MDQASIAGAEQTPYANKYQIGPSSRRPLSWIKAQIMPDEGCSPSPSIQGPAPRLQWRSFFVTGENHGGTDLSGGYGPAQGQVQQLIAAGKLGDMLTNAIRNPPRPERQRRSWPTMELKNRYLKSSAPLSKVIFDGKISSVIKDALGLHTYVQPAGAGANSRPR